MFCTSSVIVTLHCASVTITAKDQHLSCQSLQDAVSCTRGSTCCIKISCYTLSQINCCVQTVRLWNRHSGACKAVLLLPSVPTAVTLMSNDLVVVIHNCTCSMFKGPKRLRHIVSSDQQHICATAILDNQLFIASVGEDLSS